jgi:DNA-binding response OmpR family regulator
MAEKAARILVVNDTQEILDLFRMLLEEEGYEVILYSYAILDMQVVSQIEPDLIILDYIFGYEKTGWQMLQKLKMTRATATIPVIICTAATREVRDIEGYLQAHSVRLVAKPFDIDALVETVRLALLATHQNSDLMRARQDEDTAPPHKQHNGRSEKLA